MPCSTICPSEFASLYDRRVSDQCVALEGSSYARDAGQESDPLTDTERVEEIMRIIVDLNPTTPPDDWYPKWDDVTDHLARLPQPLTARYMAKVAKTV